MLMIYEDDYPIIVVQFENLTTLEDTEKYLSHFDKWLSQKRQFGIVIHKSNSQATNSIQAKEDSNQVEAVHRSTIQWAKLNKSQIIQFCVGIALVTDEIETLETQRKAAPKTIKGIFGCSGQVFQTQTEAKQWIQQKM